MKTIEGNFKEISKSNPFWSSYTCFAETITGRKFIRQAIAKWFNRLVDKDDYNRGDRMTLMENLMELTNSKKTTVELKKQA